MRRLTTGILVGLLIAAGTISAADLPGFALTRMSGEPTSADTGFFLLWPNGFSATDATVHVTAAGGKEVGSLVLWAAEGEPMKILFDCSAGESAYRVSVSPGRTKEASPTWTPRSGLILETRRRKDGKADTWQDLRDLCAASEPALGRSLQPNIFLGIHPHGPTRNFVSIFKGIFLADKPGIYAFATVSDNASCLLVDGTMVAQWVGRHDVNGGRRAQHNGRIKLTAGRHRIEYLNVTEGWFIVSAAWKRPDADTFEIMPASAFAPVARYELAPPGPHPPPSQPLVRMAWEIKEHFMVNDMAVVVVAFRAMDPPRGGGEYRWSFDDGVHGTGAAVEHLFLSPGMRSVKLEYLERGRILASTEQIVSVHPLWSQEKDSPKDIFRDQRQAFLTAEAAHAPLDDILNVFRIGDVVGNAKLTLRAATAALDRRAEFKPDQAQSLYDLAFFFQRPTVKQYAQAEKAFADLLALAGLDPRLRETARLHQAGLRLHMLDRVDAAQADLQALDAGRLTESDRRMKAIYEGDLLLAQGRVDAARQAYLAVGTTASPDDTRYAIRRRARIETARDYLQRGEYDDAERVIREIEWETPVERLNTETGLMWARCHIGRQEYTAAFARCRRLLKAAETDARRPDLLYCLVEVALAMRRPAEAADAYQRLLKDHPYSEAAARAKEKWAGRKF